MHALNKIECKLELHVQVTYGLVEKNNARLKKQTKNSEIKHRPLCVNQTLVCLRSNVQRQFEYCLNPTMMILYSSWYIFVIQNNVNYFPLFSEEVFDIKLQKKVGHSLNTAITAVLERTRTRIHHTLGT